MPTLLLRLVGPLQSWGTTSRFDERDTGQEPSKSGVVGLLAAAMGIDRENWTQLEPLTRLRMGVRHDRPGTPKRDYQTAGCASEDTIIKADGKPSQEGVVSRRHYLADAAFLVGLQGDDRALLEAAHARLQNPVWLLCLGRKSYLPSEPIWIADGLQDAPMREILIRWPWIATRRKGEVPPEKLLVSWDCEDRTGTLRMDQPLSSFAQRRFGARFVSSHWIPFPLEAAHVPA
jgi:CRISPR system Cascade subunit CasD